LLPGIGLLLLTAVLWLFRMVDRFSLFLT
jgi:hypothetical protein